MVIWGKSRYLWDFQADPGVRCLLNCLNILQILKRFRKYFQYFFKFFEKSVDKAKFLDYYRHIKQKHLINKTDQEELLEKEDGPMGH